MILSNLSILLLLISGSSSSFAEDHISRQQGGGGGGDNRWRSTSDNGCTTDYLGSEVSRLKSSPICVIVNDGELTVNTEYARWFFTPEADTYTQIKIPNSYQQLVKEQNIFMPSVSFNVQSYLESTFNRLYFNNSTQQVFPNPVTVIVDVDDGAVRSLSFDDSCIFCESNRCVPNTYNFEGLSVSGDIYSDECYLTVAECDELVKTDSAACDLSIYVVWTGFDKNGKLLDSVNSRFSAFSSKTMREDFGL